jgi:hypothetical protein
MTEGIKTAAVLQTEKVVGSGQVAKSHHVYALSDDIGEILKDGRQLEDGWFLSEMKKVTGHQGDEGQAEVQDQHPLCGRIPLINVGGILEQIGERQVIAFQHHPKARVVDRRIKLRDGLPDRRKLQAVGVDDGLEVLLIEFPPQNPLTGCLKIEKKNSLRDDQNQLS